MKWTIPILTAGVLLASTAAIVVFAGPGDTPSEVPAVVTEDPSDGIGDGALDGVGVSQAGDGDEQGAEAIAQVIADAFTIDGQEVLAEDVLALHERDIGFGVLFQLYALASVMEDTSVADLLTMFEQGTGLGELRSALTEAQLEALQSGPRNLGELVAASHRPEGAGPGTAGEAAAGGLEQAQEQVSAHVSNGYGPPDDVPRGGPHADGG